MMLSVIFVLQHGHSHLSPPEVPQQNGGAVIAVTSFSVSSSDKSSITSEATVEQVLHFTSVLKTSMSASNWRVHFQKLLNPFKYNQRKSKFCQIIYSFSICAKVDLNDICLN